MLHLLPEKWHSEGIIELHCAFSREKNEKVYVQHLMVENGEDVYNLIKVDYLHITHLILESITNQGV